MAKTVTISGQILFKDKTPIKGAKIKVWEVDKKNADDVMVNDTSDGKGNFSGSGQWKDAKGIEIANYRYEVTYKGKKKTGKGIRDKAFFNKLQTGWTSPAQDAEAKAKQAEKDAKKEEKKNITLEGKVIYKDKTPAKGLRVRIWETDNFHKNNNDDLIVDDITDRNGNYSGTGPGKDVGGIQTFRWRIDIPGSDTFIESKNKELTKAMVKTIQTGWKDIEWKNWILDHDTIIKEPFYFEVSSRKELKDALDTANANNKKVKVVGSGHSHSAVAQPASNNALINIHGLKGHKIRYKWTKNKVESNIDNGIFTKKEERLKVKSYERFLAGTTVRDLYRKLAKMNLALINMGPFDGQTLAGVVNTNTHGTGIDLPGFSDMVVSMEMYVIIPNENGGNDIELWVIEPSNGMSDPDKFKQFGGDRRLVQNDDVFNSAVCGYGLFGVVYSYTLATRSYYWMEEFKEKCINWKEFNKQFSLEEKGIPTMLKDTAQVKVYINTAQCLNRGGLNDKTDVRLDTWIEHVYDKKDEEEGEGKEGDLKIPLKEHGYEDGIEAIHKIWPPMRKRAFFGLQLQQLSESLINSTGKPSKAILTMWKGFFGFDIDPLDKDKAKDTRFMNGFNASSYYRAIRRGRDNNIAYDKDISRTEVGRTDNTITTGEPVPQDYGTSIEICVPIGKTLETIETVMNHIQELNTNLFVPTGVRFTAKSNQFLAPAYKRASAFIEITGFLPSKNIGDTATNAGKEMSKLEKSIRDKDNNWPKRLRIYADAFESIINHLEGKIDGVRFHKGKFNVYDVDSLRTAYPESFDKWLSMYHLFSSSEMLDCPNSESKWKLTETRPRTSKAAMGRNLRALITV